MSGWYKQQAKAQLQAKHREARAKEGREAVQSLFLFTVRQQTKLIRLAEAFADRCARVRQLSHQLRTEWERAERAEARVRELEMLLPATNGALSHKVEL